MWGGAGFLSPSRSRCRPYPRGYGYPQGLLLPFGKHPAEGRFMTTLCTTGELSDHDVYAAQCPCRAMLDLLANKWSALAIGAMEKGPRRFGELQRCLQGVSPKVLTRTLRRLEEAG